MQKGLPETTPCTSLTSDSLDTVHVVLHCLHGHASCGVSINVQQVVSRVVQAILAGVSLQEAQAPKRTKGIQEERSMALELRCGGKRVALALVGNTTWADRGYGYRTELSTAEPVRMNRYRLVAQGATAREHARL